MTYLDPPRQSPDANDVTAAQLFDALAEMANSINDAMDDGDRGRGDVSICLTIYEDGSGRIGQRNGCFTSQVGDWYEFEDFAEMLQLLRDQGAEI